MDKEEKHLKPKSLFISNNRSLCKNETYYSIIFGGAFQCEQFHEELFKNNLVKLYNALKTSPS